MTQEPLCICHCDEMYVEQDGKRRRIVVLPLKGKCDPVGGELAPWER